jgi:hypothetical protein
MKSFDHKTIAVLGLILAMLACSLPGVAATPGATSVPPAVPTSTPMPVVPTQPPANMLPTVPPLPSLPPPTAEPPTPTNVPHSLIPATDVQPGKLIVNDAVSVDTAPEKRAPYGDSYKYNWFERPFLKDMTYVPDMDIVSYNLSYDEKFFYISIELVGTDPNNKIGIDYGVELDINADGFGDYIIIAHPPYDVEWSTNNLQVVEDTNHDTGGLSAERSDAPLPGDGYDNVIFDVAAGIGDDFDLAWIRTQAGKKATVQFAFKRSFSGEKFFYGVIADGGLKSVADLDYVDRFTEEEAGSPEKSEKFYPLKALYGVDNVCRESFGIKGTGLEPQRCKPKPQ